MKIAMLLAAAAGAADSRAAVGSAGDGMTYGQLLAGSRRLASMFARLGGTGIAFVDINSPAVPLALYDSYER